MSAGDPIDRNAEWAGALVSGLVRGGVREAVVCPGARSAPLALALAERDPAVRLHVVVDERAAAFLALGLARAARRAVALLTTSGSAGAHAHPAVVEAWHSAVPLIVITADRPDELQACGAPQTIDQQRLFGAHTRWFAHLGPPRPGGSATWPAALAARAVDRAEGPPAGPVHLNVAFREPLWVPGAEAAWPSAPRVVRASLRVEPAQAHEALELLLAGGSAPRGAIVAGPRALAPGEDPTPVLELARRLGWPVLADPLSGLRHGPGAGEVIASADALLRDAGCARALAPSCVLRLGQLPTSKPIQSWLASAPGALLVDPQADWHDPTHGAAGLLVARSADACAGLAQAAEARSLAPAPAGWALAWSRAERAARAALDEVSRDGWWEGRLARTLVEALPAGALLQAGSSLPIRDLDAFGGARPAALTLVGQRGTNGIDGGVAAAAGAALAWRHGPVAALLGDVALVHDLGGLAAACELAAPLLLVVADNGGGGIFEQLPVAAHPRHFERLFLTPSRLDLARACAGLGAEVEEVQDPGACAAAVARALERPLERPRALLCRVPRPDSVQRREAAWAHVSRAWRSASAPALEETACPSMSR